MDKKKCFKCGKVKDLTLFYKHKMMNDGHLGKCKECTKKRSSEYSKRHPEKRRASRAAFRENNHELVLTREQSRRDRHRDRFREWHAKYRETHRAEIRESQAAYAKLPQSRASQLIATKR